jgi:hypothetical protein
MSDNMRLRPLTDERMRSRRNEKGKVHTQRPRRDLSYAWFLSVPTESLVIRAAYQGPHLRIHTARDRPAIEPRQKGELTGPAVSVPPPSRSHEVQVVRMAQENTAIWEHTVMPTKPREKTEIRNGLKESTRRTGSQFYLVSCPSRSHNLMMGHPAS